MVADRRQQILNEATAMFATRGYAGTSIRRITRGCGVTEAALYRYFKSKMHLYEEAIRQKATRHDIQSDLEAAAGKGGVEDVLRHVAEAIQALAVKDPELFRLMFDNGFDSGPAAGILFREIRLPFIKFVKDELERRMSAGEVRPVDALITARCFVGMVMDCALNVGVWTTVAEVELKVSDVIRNNIPIFARGLKEDAAG